MSTAIDVANYVKPEIVPVYKYTAEIDITPKGPTRTWANLCAGFNNISEAMNETIQQYFFLCGSGHAVNYVTGMAPSMTMAGVRVIGDAAQDYIFNQKYTLMSSRDTHFRITRTAENGDKHIISANVTFANLSDISGGTTDGSAISLEMRFNGAPFLGDAWENAATSYVVQQSLLNVISTFDESSVLAESPFVATLTPAEGYVIAGVVVSMGGVDITATAYNAETGVVSIASVTGTVVITASGSVVTAYSVTQTLTDVTSSFTGNTTAAGEAFNATLTAASGHTIGTVSVTMGGVDITETAYTAGTGAVAIASVTGNIVITATATLNTYTVTQTLTHVTSSFDGETVNYGSALTAELTADDTYTIDSVSVTMGGVDITSTAYDSDTGTVSIASVTGNVVITASATQ